MKTEQTAYLPRTTVTMHTEKRADLVLNVGYTDCMKRGFITLFLPWPALLLNAHLLMIALAPVMFYLFTSALTHFCFFKYAWQHWIKHLQTPSICDFAKDLHIPVETI